MTPSRALGYTADNPPLFFVSRKPSPMPQPIRAVHHIQITIPRDAEEAGRAFYCGVLGLPEIPKPASLQGRGGFWLQVGDREVHVGVEDGVERARSKAHIAYRVDDAEAWRAHLATHGVAIEEQVPIPGYIRFECRDPFGNRIEFIEATA